MLTALCVRCRCSHRDVELIALHAKVTLVELNEREEMLKASVSATKQTTEARATVEKFLRHYSKDVIINKLWESLCRRRKVDGRVVYESQKPTSREAAIAMLLDCRAVSDFAVFAQQAIDSATASREYLARNIQEERDARSTCPRRYQSVDTVINQMGDPLKSAKVKHAKALLALINS
jgi:hypothetical protein